MYESNIKTIDDLDNRIQGSETSEDEKFLLEAIKNFYIKMEIASNIMEEKFKNVTNVNRILS